MLVSYSLCWFCYGTAHFCFHVKYAHYFIRQLMFAVPVGDTITDDLLCQIFEAAEGACTEDSQCDVRDGKPGCV